MQHLCTYDLLNVAIKATELETGAVGFATATSEAKVMQEARYHFVYYAFTKLNARPKMIQSFIRSYHYPKTVYQVIRRQYERRKQPEMIATQQCIDISFREQLAKYEPKCQQIKYPQGKQLKIHT